MFTTSALEDTPTPELVDAFNDAFAYYQVKIDMTEQKLRTMITARSVRLDRSYGIFDGDRLVAFCLNGSRTIDGQLVAYDSGTGVRVEAQRSGLGDRLLRHTVETLRHHGYRRYVLEVLTRNHGAIRLYRKHRFVETRTVHCYRAEIHRFAAPSAAVDVTVVEDGWEARCAPLLAYTPTWQNATASVNAIADSCRLVTVGPAEQPHAFAVVCPDSGSILQLGWAPLKENAARSVVAAAAAITRTEELTLTNIDSTAVEVHEFVRTVGFEPFLSQYEMERDPARDDGERTA